MWAWLFRLLEISSEADLEISLRLLIVVTWYG